MAVGERERSCGERMGKWDPHFAGDPRELGILFTRYAEISDVVVACGC